MRFFSGVFVQNALLRHGIILVGLSVWAALDPAISVDCENERKTMDQIYEYLKVDGHPISHWKILSQLFETIVRSCADTLKHEYQIRQCLEMSCRCCLGNSEQFLNVLVSDFDFTPV